MTEAPEIPLKIELKMKARPSGTTTPIRMAERSRSRALRSLAQISQAARIGMLLVPEGPAGQVQEDRLEVRLGDLHGPDGRAGRRHVGQDGRKLAAGVLHHQVDAAVERLGLADPRPRGQGTGG